MTFVQEAEEWCEGLRPVQEYCGRNLIRGNTIKHNQVEGRTHAPGPGCWIRIVYVQSFEVEGIGNGCLGIKARQNEGPDLLRECLLDADVGRCSFSQVEAGCAYVTALVHARGDGED